MCCVYNDQAKIKSLGVQLDHNLVWTDHMFEDWSHHCLVSARPRFRKTGILMVAVWTSLESRKAQRLHIRITKKIKKHFESFCTSCWLAWITCLRPKIRPNWFLTEKIRNIEPSSKSLSNTYREQRQCWYTGTGFQNRPPLSQLLWESLPIEVQPWSKIEVYPNLLYVAIIEPYCSSSTGQPLCHPGGLQGLHLHRQIQPHHLLEGGTPIRCENVLNLFLCREYVV